MRKLKNVIAILLAAVLVLVGSQAAFAIINPSDGTLDTSFNGVLGGVSGANANVVTDSVLQPDGKVVLVGSFLTYNQANAKYVVRINGNGTIDSTFDAGTSAAKTTVGGTIQVKTVARQSDGKILVGGAFDTFQGHTTQALARLNPDGTVDTSFVSPVAPYSSTNTNVGVENVAVQSDGSLIVVGTFAQAIDSSNNVVTVNSVIKMSASGVLDTTFNTNFGGASNGTISGTSITAAGPNVTVYALAIQQDDKILIGGAFNVIGGINGSIRRGIARLLSNGTLDTSFDAALTATGSAMNSTNVYDITVDSSGKVLAAGQMGGAGSTTSPGIVRLLSTTGAYDSSFNVGTGIAGGVTRASSVTVASDGSIYLGGLFTSYNGVSRVSLARLTSTGSLDTTFAVGTGFTYPYSPNYGQVKSILALSSGDILAAGVFDAYAGVPRTGIALLTSPAALAARASGESTPSVTSASNELASTGESRGGSGALVALSLVTAGLVSSLIALARRRVKVV